MNDMAETGGRQRNPAGCSATIGASVICINAGDRRAGHRSTDQNTRLTQIRSTDPAPRPGVRAGRKATAPTAAQPQNTFISVRSTGDS